MKRRILSFLLLFLPAVLWGGQQQVLPIGEFGGLDTDTHPLLLDKDKSPDSENVVTDEKGGIGPREGYIQYSTVPSSNLWVLPHSNGTRYLITQDGGYLKADTGARTFTTTISTVATGVTTVGAVLGDYFYFANRTDGLKRWDTSSVTVASAALTVDKLVSWKGRLVAAGKSGSERTLFISKYLDGATWNLATTPTEDDPAQIQVSGALDEIITALYADFRDMLMVFTASSFRGLIGSRRSAFKFYTFSSDIGTAYPDSIRDCGGLLRFLGPRRTSWEFNGATYQKISESIDNLMATVQQGDANSRSYTITTQADYQAGTSNFTSAVVSAGDLVLSTWTDTDTDSADFAAGTLTNLTTTTVAGSVHLSTNNVDVNNNGFESGSGATTITNWTRESAGATEWIRDASAARSGSFGLKNGTGVGATYILQILNYLGNVIATSSGYTPANGSWTQRTFSLASYRGRNIKIQFYRAGTAKIYSDLFFCSGENLTWYDKGDGGTNFYIDDLAGGSSTIFSGDIVSQTFDTALYAPKWLAGSATASANDHTLSYETQVSADGASWDSLVSWTPGSAPTSASKRYIRYKISFATATAGTALPYVEDVTHAARASTGSWVGPHISIGSSATAWGIFNANTDLNDGTVVYTLYTDSDTNKTVTNGVPDAATYTGSQTVTNGSIPTVALDDYAFIGVAPTITVATQTPTNHDLVLRWSEGSTLRVASSYYKERWNLAVAINSATNNRWLVYDRNQEWQRWTLPADAMVIHTGNLLFGTSTGIWQPSGNSDNGSAISAYYRTKMYVLGESEDTRSFFNSLYTTTAQSAGTLSTTFTVNDNGDFYSLGSKAMNATEGIQNIYKPFSFSDVQQGKYVGFKWAVSSTADWNILGGNFYFTPELRPSPE